MADFSALFIAPNKQLAAVANEVAADYPDFATTVHEGDLSQGLAAALGSFDVDYDVVISRGGTAQLLEEEFSVPVIEVGISEADLLSALLEHNPQGRRTAVVGFSNALEMVEQYANFSDFDLDVFGISFEDELPLALQDVVAGAYEVVLCDTFSLYQSLALGLNAHLLASGEKSVAKAFDQALFLCQQTLDLRLKMRVLWKFIRGQASRLAIFSADGKLVYSNLTNSKTELVAFMRAHLDGEDDAQLVMQRSRQLFRIRRMRVDEGDGLLIAFSVTTSNVPLKDNLVGIVRRNRDAVDHAYHESVFHLVHAGDALAGPIARASRGDRPVLLEGEPGCGVSQVAALLYLSGSWGKHPYVTIDCSMLTNKSWEHLMNSHHSPLYETEQTIYLRAVHRLPGERLKTLVEVVTRMGVCERNHVIISAVCNPGEKLPEVVGLLTERIRCHILPIPPLRQRADLRQAFSLYLNALARLDGTRAPLVTDEAMELLSAHPWTNNYAELRQVLQRAASQAGDGRVTAAVVREALRWTGVGVAAERTDDLPQVDLSLPLKDIEKTVVRLVLARCGNNQTEAARSLGVSRTTIWRLLRD